MKTVTELQSQFFKETGAECVNSQGEPDIDYMQWLEQKIIIPVQSEGTRVTPTDEILYEIIDYVRNGAHSMNDDKIKDELRSLISPVSTNTVTDEEIIKIGYHFKETLPQAGNNTDFIIAIEDDFVEKIRQLFSQVSCNKVAEPDGYIVIRELKDSFYEKVEDVHYSERDLAKPIYFSPLLEPKNKELKIVFEIDGGKFTSKEYTPIELLNKDEQGILEDMEVCDCPLNESNNHCEGDCFRFENSSITGCRVFSPLLETKVKDTRFEGIIGKEIKKIKRKDSEWKKGYVYGMEYALSEYRKLNNKTEGGSNV